ncbi:TPA: hypothetical protein ACSVPQ_004242 [Clostridioides difficile]|nr:hypothetical protein [Clostridioides difficile]MDI2980293.1 hypothetical protein [Clostridioides difficile]MDI6151606.1 hypothetical protein [Clostridioides difficile]MDI7828077.1 hypothetical protein [Clostridioides difficile]
MEYVIANAIIITIAIIGSFILSRVNEGFFMGMNSFYIAIYIRILGIFAIIVNLVLVVIDLY